MRQSLWLRVSWTGPRFSEAAMLARRERNGNLGCTRDRLPEDVVTGGQIGPQIGGTLDRPRCARADSGARALYPLCATIQSYAGSVRNSGKRLASINSWN